MVSRGLQEVPENQEDREVREQPGDREKKEPGESPEHKGRRDFRGRWDLLVQREASGRSERRENRERLVSRDFRAKEEGQAALVNPAKGENQDCPERPERGVCRVHLEFLDQPDLEEKRVCLGREDCPDSTVQPAQRGLRDPWDPTGTRANEARTEMQVHRAIKVYRVNRDLLG